MGVPMIGCRCAVCRSTDPRDKRWRPSVVVRLDSGLTVLVDTSTDLRTQALAFELERVDAVLYTHGHADHVLGLDELRRYNTLQRSAIPLYADERTLGELRRVFAYAFARSEHGHEYVPQLAPFTVKGPFSLGRTVVQPVPISHGAREIFGYRIGRFAYLTDCSGIPDASWPMLQDLDLVVVGALRESSHPSHFSLSEAVDAATRIGARQALFTHMCHDLGHAATCARLPSHIQLAYDGLTVDVAGE
jgi:phosphoribosyl 1,2-cyclic phosphate phosphodiesterase